MSVLNDIYGGYSHEAALRRELERVKAEQQANADPYINAAADEAIKRLMDKHIAISANEGNNPIRVDKPVGVKPQDIVDRENEYVPGRFYQDMLEKDAERRKAEHDKDVKKLKRDAILAGIGDAFNAFHQAYANARGTKPMTTGNMSAKVRERYDKMMQDYKAHQDQYLNARMRAMQMDDAKAENERNYKLKLRQQERLEKDAQTRAAKAEAYSNYQQSVISKNEAQAAYWSAKANALEAGMPLEEAIKRAEEARKQAQTRQANSAADASDALAEQRRRNDGGYTEEVEETDHRGNTKKKKVVRKPNGASQDGNYDQYKVREQEDYSQYRTK